MKRKRHAKRLVRSRKQKRNSLVGFVFTGLFNDLGRVLKVIFKVIGLVFHAIIKIVGWPVHAISHLIHREVKQYPHLAFLQNRRVISVALGLVLLAVSFAVEHISQHFLWGCSIETMRAAGVCPVWEAIAGTIRAGSEEIV